MAYLVHIIIDEVCVILSCNTQRVVGYTFTTDYCESQREATLRVLYQRHVCKGCQTCRKNISQYLFAICSTYIYSNWGHFYPCEIRTTTMKSVAFSFIGCKQLKIKAFSNFSHVEIRGKYTENIGTRPY